MYSNPLMFGGLKTPVRQETGSGPVQYRALVMCSTLSPFHAVYDLDFRKQGDFAQLPGGAGYVAKANHAIGLLAIGHLNSPNLSLYDLSDFSKRAAPAGIPAYNVICLAFSPDGRYLALGQTGGEGLVVYDTADWSKVAIPDIVGDRVYDLEFSPDGALLAAATDIGAYVYNVADWSRRTDAVLTAIGGVDLYSCKFSPDGLVLAFGGASAPYLWLIAISDWAALPLPAQAPADAVRILAFSPDGSVMAARHNGAPYLGIYETVGWACIATLRAQDPGVFDEMIFSPDGESLWLSEMSALVRYETTGWSAVAGVDVPPAGNVRGIAYV